MPKVHLVQPEAPPRDDRRQALAVAIEHSAALRAALDENLISQRRAEEAFWPARSAVDAAVKTVEQATVSDAESLAAGKPTRAVKAARNSLTDAEDELAAARSAQAILADQQTDLSNRLGIADSRVKEAVSAVVHNAPELRRLTEQFRAAQVALHDALGAMSALMPHFPAASNSGWWETSGLPSYARFWDAVNWEKDLPPSATAARVKDWIERLRADADAVLE
jgi:chromosome segregation ATPase